MASALENMKRTAQAVLDSYRKWDIEAIMAQRSDDCVYQMLPKSLGRPLTSNEEYREMFKHVVSAFREMPLTVDNEAYDTDSRKAALHVYSDAQTPVGEYNNEFSIFLTFNDDGTKVKYMGEMVDSAYLAHFQALLAGEGGKHS